MPRGVPVPDSAPELAGAAEWPPPVGAIVRSVRGLYVVLEHRDSRVLGEHVAVRRTVGHAIETRPITRADWTHYGYRCVR